MAKHERHYYDDLAYIHHVGYGNFAANAASGLIEVLRSHDICHGRVVDLGCGSGIFAAALTRAGYDVLGIDQSAGMLKLARKNAPHAKFRRSSYLQTKLPSDVLCVTALGEVFSYKFDESAGKQTLFPFFRKVYDALPTGGLFIFDVASPGSSRSRGSKAGGARGDDWAFVLRTNEDDDQQLLTREISIFRKVGTTYRRTEEVHQLQLYRPSEIAKELRQVGFRVRYVHQYGDLRFPKGLVGFIARK